MTDQPDKKPGAIEQLVAYLDGELNDEQTATIEKQLRKDPKLRHVAEGLDRTWGMLDALESVAASEEFSQETVRTVVATELPAAKQRTWSVGKFVSSLVRSQALGWFGIGVVGTLCGLGITTLLGASEESVQATQLLKQIDLLQRYPEYSIVPDVESLRQLQLPNPATPGPQEEK